jgi:23S rRNA (uracil1939-C5)-methyltransferase
MAIKNEVVRLEITALTNEGNGVGRHEGLTVFVPQTAVGDVINARLVKLYPRYAYGRLETLLVPSPDRVEPDCPVYRFCGGCALRHIGYMAELRAKQRLAADAFTHIGGFSETLCRPIVGCFQINGYRNKAMYPVRRVQGEVRIGFYRRRTHEVVEASGCLLQPEEFSQIAGALRQFLEETGLSCYDEQTGKGLVRHLYLRRAEVTGQILVCLILNGKKLPQAGRFLELLDALALPIETVALNQNLKNTNVILGDKTVVLRGSSVISDVLCGVRVKLSPESFYQVNHDAAEKLYRFVEECAALDGSQTLLDLYCGAGTIGLSMAGKAKELIGVEVIPQAVENARRNAEDNGIGNARFLCADAQQAAMQLAGEGIHPDVVVMDPPRKGCSPQTLETVAGMAPSRVVMVSCNPATAARDCKQLEAMGYQLESVTPFDLFPRTGHVETVCLLSHKNPTA